MLCWHLETIEKFYFQGYIFCYKWKWKWSCSVVSDSLLPMDCSPPGSSVHVKWVAISFSRGFSWPRDRTQVSRIPGRRFNLWATIFCYRTAPNVWASISAISVVLLISSSLSNAHWGHSDTWPDPSKRLAHIPESAGDPCPTHCAGLSLAPDSGKGRSCCTCVLCLLGPVLILTSGACQAGKDTDSLMPSVALDHERPLPANSPVQPNVSGAGGQVLPQQ